jgi:hypothetical protein
MSPPPLTVSALPCCAQSRPLRRVEPHSATGGVLRLTANTRPSADRTAEPFQMASLQAFGSTSFPPCLASLAACGASAKTSRPPP